VLILLVHWQVGHPDACKNTCPLILQCLVGWEEGHPARKKTHFNTPYYQGVNRLTQVHVENGHENGVFEYVVASKQLKLIFLILTFLTGSFGRL